MGCMAHPAEGFPHSEFPKVSDRFPSSFGTVCVLKKNAQEKDNHLAVALWTPMRSRTISIPSSS